MSPERHEQNNATVNESGGATGMLTNLSALRRWIVAGPEIERLVLSLKKNLKLENIFITNSVKEF